MRISFIYESDNTSIIVHLCAPAVLRKKWNRQSIKFCAKLKKYLKETNKMIREEYGECALS